MKLPGWFRAITATVADGVRDVRISQDGERLHVLAYITTMPDDGDMVTVWQHRTVDLRSGWVDCARYEREPDDAEDRDAAEPGFWSWAAVQAQELMVPLSPTETPWELCDGDQSDTQRPSGPVLHDGLRIFRNERMLVESRVQLLRAGRAAATFAITGATSVFGGSRKTLWVGAGRESSHVIIVAGALRPSVLVVDVAHGRKLLHTRV